MYQAIYKCRLCREIIEDKILRQPDGANRIMRNMVFENDKLLRSEPHPINKCDCHYCKDGSLGFVDFQGFKKVEE